LRAVRDEAGARVRQHREGACRGRRVHRRARADKLLPQHHPVLSPAAPAVAAIVVTDLRKRYVHVEAVRGVSFAVTAGTTTALLGGNGAGKTTTLSMLLGVLTPTAGTIRVLGEDMTRHPHRVLPRLNFTSPYVDLPK